MDRTRRGLAPPLPPRLLDQMPQRRTVLAQPEGRIVPRVNLRRALFLPGRQQHAHEIRGDPGMARRQAEGQTVLRLGRLVIAFEAGEDADAVGDPGRRGTPSRRFARSPEVPPRVVQRALGERRPPRAEERFRLDGRRFLRQRRGPEEIVFRGRQVVVEGRDICQPEERFGSLVEAFGQGAV